MGVSIFSLFFSSSTHPINISVWTRWSLSRNLYIANICIVLLYCQANNFASVGSKQVTMKMGIVLYGATQKSTLSLLGLHFKQKLVEPFQM